MTDLPSHSVPSSLTADGENNAIWLRTLRNCALTGGALVVVLSLIALLITSTSAMLSVLVTAAVVMAFFSLSLLAAHVFGKHFEHGAVATFVPVYLVKVIALGLLLWLVRTPEWYDGTWALWTALAVVLLWQAVEIFTFSRARLIIYSESQSPAKSSLENGHAHG